MKKTFLSLIFAITMGVSLFAGTLKSANAEPILSGTNIKMTTDESYTFDDATSVTLISGESVKVTDKTISADGVGESVIDVDGIKYTVSIKLPTAYLSTEYASFENGSIIDTQYAFQSENIRLSFNFSGNCPNFSFGCDDGADQKTTVCYSGEIRLGSPSSIGQTYMGEGLDKNHDDKTYVDLVTNDSQYTLNIGGRVYVEPRKTGNTMVCGGSFRFGLMSRLGDGKGYFLGKLFNLRIEDDGVTQVNYWPCYNPALDEFGFYDLVEKKFVSCVNSSYPLTYNMARLRYKSSSGSIIEPQNNILIFDKEADFANMDGALLAAEGSILTGTVQGASLTLGQSELNLETIFGKMNAGTNYELTVSYNTFVSTYQIKKTNSKAAKMHLSLLESKNYLGRFKSMESNGKFVFEADGETIEGYVDNIHGRGNHNSEYGKNSYSIKLSKSTALIPGAKAQKKYALTASHGRSGLSSKDQLGYTLYQKLCKTGEAINYRPVDLWINGVYEGYYNLTERVRIDEEIINITKPEMEEGSQVRIVNSSTANISPEEQEILDSGIKEFKYCTDTSVTAKGGYVIESGWYYNDAKSGFITSHKNAWEIKDPDALSLEQISSIAIYMQKAEDALFSETGFNKEGIHYSTLFDFDSMARHFLVKSFMLDCDIYITSTYLYIDGDNAGLKGLIKAGPVWDFNYDSMANSSRFYENATHPYTEDHTMTACFREELTTKGDFMKILSDIFANEFKNILREEIIDNTQEFLDKYHFLNYDSLVNTDNRWNANTANENYYYLVNAYNRANSYINVTFNPIYNRINGVGNFLKGVSIYEKNGTLIAETDGGLDCSYQWYTVDSSKQSCSIVEGATDKTLETSQKGLYFVKVTSNHVLPGSVFNYLTSNVLSFSSCTLTYDMCGHGTQIPSSIVNANSKLYKPATPIEEGYVFKGWYKEPEFINRWIFAEDIITEDVTLYAKWEEGGTLFNDTSMSLKENAWLNMYTFLIDDDASDYKFTYSLDNAEMENPTEEVAISSDMFNKVGSEWRVSVALMPYQYADDVTIFMYDLAGNLICSKTDSIRDYAMLVINSSKATQAEKDAATALLRYGAASQKLRGYNVDDLADKYLDD